MGASVESTKGKISELKTYINRNVSPEIQGKK